MAKEIAYALAFCATNLDKIFETNDMKTRLCLKYSANGCLCTQVFAFNSPQTPSNLIFFLTNFVILRPLALFQPKIRAAKLQKSIKICLTW